MDPAVNESLDAYWPDILGVVRRKVPQQTYDTWFLPLQPQESSDGEPRVGCPNHFFLDWFSEHHLRTLNEAGSSFFGRVVCFRLVVPPVEGATMDAYDDLFVPEKPEIFPVDVAPARGRATSVEGDFAPRVNLNPDYTFANFVVGSGTDLAYAAASAVASTPGDHFNPLFVYGGVGLGKTHLMHAIGNHIRASRPAARICYVTAEQFMSELILAIQQRKQPEFKIKYRSVDVLLVDDVAFLAGKESTQEEFFHTFNALHDLKKQIVLTSDRSPKEITTLEERLRSRFEWGLITDIQPPNLETRIAILKRKVDINGIAISDDVIQFIAANITDNIRRLEGALVRLLAFASLTRRDIDLEMASEVLSSFFQGPVTGPTRIADVVEVVADYFDFTVDQLKSKRRTQDLARARQVAMHLARELTGASLNQIGRALGGRDHSTVSHACQTIKDLIEKDPRFRGIVKDIYARLRERR
jgi:chromosomal replication initiator protein